MSGPSPQAPTEVASTPSGDHRLPIIVLAGSAGGLAAVTAILSELPGGFPGVVIVLLHQEPDRVSRLVDILARRTALEVVPALDGLPLTAGTVVVTPPGHHVLVRPGGYVVLIESGEYPPNRPSADLLLASLAVTVGADATAVVLSGHGHDGATGATAIHACGGTVIATDERSSENYGMPHATIRRDSAVDHVVELSAIPALLGTIAGSSALR